MHLQRVSLLLRTRMATAGQRLARWAWRTQALWLKFAFHHAALSVSPGGADEVAPARTPPARGCPGPRPAGPHTRARARPEHALGRLAQQVCSARPPATTRGSTQDPSHGAPGGPRPGWPSPTLHSATHNHPQFSVLVCFLVSFPLPCTERRPGKDWRGCDVVPKRERRAAG